MYLLIHLFFDLFFDFFLDQLSYTNAERLRKLLLNYISKERFDLLHPSVLTIVLSSQLTANKADLKWASQITPHNFPQKTDLIDRPGE